MAKVAQMWFLVPALDTGGLDPFKGYKLFRMPLKIVMKPLSPNAPKGFFLLPGKKENFKIVNRIFSSTI